jgi:hypothetical protein
MTADSNVLARNGHTSLVPTVTVVSKRISASSAWTWSNHISALASLGIRQSPRGDNATEPTFGPSGMAERLNCCEKKRL